MTMTVAARPGGAAPLWNREISQSSQCQGRNGLRVAGRSVHILRNDKFPVFLIAAFPKNAKESLTQAERNALKKRSDGIFNYLL